MNILKGENEIGMMPVPVQIMGNAHARKTPTHVILPITVFKFKIQFPRIQIGGFIPVYSCIVECRR